MMKGHNSMPETDDFTVADKWARDTWKMFAIVAAIVLLAVGLGAVYLKGITDKSALDAAQTRTIKCVSNWSDRYTARADLLQKLANPRNDSLAAEIDALNGLLRVLPTHNQPEIKTDFQLALVAAQRFTEANRAYQAAVKAHPVPASPKLACAIHSDNK